MSATHSDLPSSPPPPSSTSTPNVDAPDAQSADVRLPRPWYDLGFTFTPRQATVLLLFLAAGVGFSFALDRLISRFIDLDERAIGQWIEGLGVLGPLAYIALLAATIIFSPLPSVVVNIAGGLAFGLVLGVLYTMVGALLGAAVNFYVARRFGRGWLARKLGRTGMSQIDALAERMGARVIFLTRLIPLFNFDWVSYAAGLTAIRFRTYMVASALGMLLPVIGIVYVGDTLLSHPGRSATMFSALVVWSAIPPVVFLLWAGGRTVGRRLRRTQPDSAVRRSSAEGVE